LFGSRVVGLEHTGSGWQVRAQSDGQERMIEADHVWATIPVTIVARAVSNPAAPQDVVAASGKISYRAMLLVYLALDVDQFAEYDAHYFPTSTIRITRLSEPKNYAPLPAPTGRTVLCAELPCAPGDEFWRMSD